MQLKNLDAYELVSEQKLTDIQSEGRILRHKKSGARIAVISNEDENKVFSIGFRTPPEDETGVPHIIEHTVLCGSEKYPVKDPFVELVKGSLNTFLNAMTYPDKTMYPVASCNDKDFQNLMDVYLDAVLHPNIYKYEEIFRQEGWHYELESKDAPLTINGVVYNEMKGAYSSPDQVLFQEISRSLFPDNTYGKNSGGDPKYIPELTYQDYLNFHRRYYHPVNSYIYLYGNMDVAEKLDWLDKAYLSAYDRIELDSSIPEQKPFSHSVDVSRYYPIASEEPEEDNTYLSYNTVVGGELDKTLYQAFDILDYALVSAPGAPLKKALIDAGIGKDISGGYESGILQPIFSVIAKKANTSDKERFLSIIRSTLEMLVQNGMDQKALLAGINRAEFRFREADFGHYPKGLLYGIQCMDSWLFDEQQPFMHLQCLDTYAFLKTQVSQGYFEKLIQTYLLDNPHASVVVVEPKKGLGAQEEEEGKQMLEAYKKTLSETEVENLIEDTKQLKDYQEEESSQEDLEKIPMLERKDLRREIIPLSNRETEIGGVKALHHDIRTNGIDYLTFLFDARDVAQDEIPYLGILKSVLGYVDTRSFSYSDLVNEINLYTGGISGSLSLYVDSKKPENLQVKYEIYVKNLHSNLSHAMRILEEILNSSNLEDEKRLREILAQTRTRLQQSLSNGGHVVSATRSLAGISNSAYYTEATSGILFYQTVSDLEENFEEKKEILKQHLKKLMGQLFTTNRLMISYTGVTSDLEEAAPVINGFLEALPKKEAPKSATEISFTNGKEGFTDASRIQYVSQTGSFTAHGFAYTGALRLLKQILSFDYLWMNIRVKGGAYGCMSGFQRSGETYFTSYRDPNLEKTLDVYRNIPEYLRGFHVNERDMTKYVIGTFSTMDTPMYPEAEGTRSLTAYLSNLTEEDLQKERDEVLYAKQEDVQNLADLIEAVLQDNRICVIGNEEKIQQQKDLFDSIRPLKG